MTFQRVVLLVYFTIPMAIATARPQGSHHYDGLLSNRGKKDNVGRRHKSLRSICKANPSSALCRHESGPDELEVISRQQFDLMPTTAPSISPTSTPTIAKGAEGSGASSEPSSAPSQSGAGRPSGSSGGPVFPSSVGSPVSLAPAAPPGVQGPGSPSINPLSTSGAPNNGGIPTPGSPPSIGQPLAIGAPSNQNVPTPKSPTINPPSAIGAPSMSMIPSSYPTLEFLVTAPSRGPSGIQFTSPSDELKINYPVSRNSVPAYAWVSILCILLILIILIIVWWLKRVQKVDTLDQTRREKIQLQRLNESDATYTSNLLLTPIKHHMLPLRPPSIEEDNSDDGEAGGDGDIEDGDTTDEDSESSSSVSESESDSRRSINPGLSRPTESASSDSSESEMLFSSRAPC